MNASELRREIAQLSELKHRTKMEQCDALARMNEIDIECLDRLERDAYRDLQRERLEMRHKATLCDKRYSGLKVRASQLQDELQQILEGEKRRSDEGFRLLGEMRAHYAEHPSSLSKKQEIFLGELVAKLDAVLAAFGITALGGAK